MQRGLFDVLLRSLRYRDSVKAACISGGARKFGGLKSGVKKSAISGECSYVANNYSSFTGRSYIINKKFNTKDNDKKQLFHTKE
jgi:hypothetical protein